MDWIDKRMTEMLSYLNRLLESPTLQISRPSQFPIQSGIYCFSVIDALVGDYIRAGSTTNLRQRIYQNHLMGDQSGNLRTQLVRDKVCTNLIDAKDWIRNSCFVQYLVIENQVEREWAEHFMISILRPKYSDKHKSGLVWRTDY